MSNAIFITFIHPNINISGNPHNHGEDFDAPPTLERSGSELRRAVSSLSPEGERGGVRGGALFKGKEGRGDFRKDTPISLRVIEFISLILEYRSF